MRTSRTQRPGQGLGKARQGGEARAHGAVTAIVASPFFLRENPNSKLFGKRKWKYKNCPKKLHEPVAKAQANHHTVCYQTYNSLVTSIVLKFHKSSWGEVGPGISPQSLVSIMKKQQGLFPAGGLFTGTDCRVVANPRALSFRFLCLCPIVFLTLGVSKRWGDNYIP